MFASRVFGHSIGIYPEFIDGYGVLGCRRPGATADPYRSLLPRAIRNLIVAGRATEGTASRRGDGGTFRAAVTGSGRRRWRRGIHSRGPTHLVDGTVPRPCELIRPGRPGSPRG